MLDRINNPIRAKTMAGTRMVLKDWEKHLREYHAAGGTEYQTDELKCMLLRRILPCDDKKKLTHREFAEGAYGTIGESYTQMRQRIVDTITREELEVQNREGKILGAEEYEENVFKNDEEIDEEEPMGEEELHSLFAAMDSGVLSLEQLHALQRKIQKKGRCFNCGRPGHFAKYCRSAK